MHVVFAGQTTVPYGVFLILDVWSDRAVFGLLILDYPGPGEPFLATVNTGHGEVQQV